jgi:hypothetical protein
MKEKTRQEGVELYEAPMIEVIEMVIEQNILQSSSGNGSPDDMPGEVW